MKYFHIHIYFEENQIDQALSLIEEGSCARLFDVIKMQEKPVGPHPTGMVELHFKEPCYSQALDWVNYHRGILTAMIHQDTGDDYKDHTDHIQWIGPKLVLDFEFFELIKSRPDLRLNPL